MKLLPEILLYTRPMASLPSSLTADDEGFYESVMKDSQAAAWKKSNTMSGKLSVSVRTSGRTALKNLPVTVLRGAAGKIPIVGAEIASGVTFLAGKIRDNRVKNRALNAILNTSAPPIAEEGDVEPSSSASKDVKAVAKDLQLIVKSFDSNIQKFMSEVEEVKTGLNNLSAVSNGTYATFMDQYSKLSYHYFRLLHYTEKLANMRDEMAKRMEICSNYVNAMDNWAVDLEPGLKDVFAKALDAVDDQSAGLLRTRGSSSSS